MKKLFERFPWLQQAGCGVLVCALLLSICLPLMGMRSAEAGGASNFVREYTLASGGPYCDCGYQKRS